MKFLYLSLFMIIYFSSCQKSEGIDDTIKISINNDTLYYFPKLNTRETQKNDEHITQAINVIKYQITNTSNKRYLLLIKDVELFNIYGIHINILGKNGLIKPSIPLGDPAFPIDSACYYRGKYDLISAQYLMKKKVLQKLGAKNNYKLFESYMNQSIVIEPGETKELSTTISLPYVQGINKNIPQPFVGFDLDSTKSYLFSLKYKLDKKNLIDELTTEQIRELKSNKIEIFAGEVESNKVQLITKQ